MTATAMVYPIDFSRFTTTTRATMPIVEHWGKYNGRLIESNTEDGWYIVEFGSNINIIRKATMMEIEEATKVFKKLRGYPLGEEIVPVNFQNLYDLGKGETVRAFFLQSPAWDIVRIGQSPHDSRFYSLGSYYGRRSAEYRDAQRRFEDGGSLSGLRGITPEQRYYWLLLSLQKQSYEAYQEIERLHLSSTERNKRIKEFASQLPMRIQHEVRNSGGRFVSFEKYGKNKFLIRWEVGGQEVKTVVENDLRVYDAGFCLSGDDRKHNLASIVSLARLFQHSNPLYITRD
jgi:hypothetical protein